MILEIRQIHYIIMNIPFTVLGRQRIRVTSAILHIFIAGIIVATGTGWGPAAKAATTASSEPPHGLMIQVSSLAPSISPTQLKSMLEKVRAKHRISLASPGYINSVVLQDIADQNGKLLTTYLDVIKPYLPGGKTPAFTTAYVGTVDLAWTGTGSKYIEGIASSTFRNKNVALSNTAAKAFSVRYPTLKYNWYITYEANLGAFWNDAVKNNYTAYINQLAASLSTVKSGKTFMWSPAFWTNYAAMPAWALPSLQLNIKDASSKITMPFILNLQDFVGQSSGATTREDAVVWMNYLKTNWKAARTTHQINVEQFVQSSTGAITAANPAEIAARSNYYAQQGLTLGPTWEIRFWYQRLYVSQ